MPRWKLWWDQTHPREKETSIHTTRKGCQQSIYTSISLPHPHIKPSLSFLHSPHHYSTPSTTATKDFSTSSATAYRLRFCISMTTDEDWVKEAMTDDAVVVEMLLRLHAAQIPSTPKRKAAAPPLQLEWTVRQRRSRPAIRHLADSSNNNSNSSIKKKKGEATRASPTTPLSWSGATSQSGGGGGGGADGFEESSRPARSKVVAGTSETTTTKRSRKKKTLAELREEESMLLKERRSLKTELTTLHQRLENQRATNESLKRMKLDLQSQQTFKPVTSSVASEETISDQLQHLEAASHPTTSKPADVGNLSLLHSSFEAEEVESQDTGFLLPDLNVALEEDSCPKVICGMS